MSSHPKAVRTEERTKKGYLKKGRKALTKDGTGTENRDAEEELTDTVFLRNVSRFDTTQEKLKEFMEKNFGETVYCLICKDKDTGESKGTAFVKFKSVDTAMKCLEEFEDQDLQTKFFLDGRNLFVLPALTRDKISEVRRASAKRNGEDEAGEKKPKIRTKPRHNRPPPKNKIGEKLSEEFRSTNKKNSHKISQVRGKVRKDIKSGSENKKSQVNSIKRKKNNPKPRKAHQAGKKVKLPNTNHKSSKKKPLQKKRGRHPL